jgi:hypothetical protein
VHARDDSCQLYLQLLTGCGGKFVRIRSGIRAEHGTPIATCCRECLCTSFIAAGLDEVVDQPT